MLRGLLVEAPLLRLRRHHRPEGVAVRHARHGCPHVTRRRRPPRFGFLLGLLGDCLLFLRRPLSRLIPRLAFHRLHQPLHPPRFEERLGRFGLRVVRMYLAL